MDREELAWAAGFFDGEGSTWHLKNKRGNYLFVSIGQKNISNLERFQKAVLGFGHIEVHTKKDGVPTVWRWRTGKFEHSQATIAMLWNWLGREKKDQAKVAIEKYTKIRMEQNG